MRRSRGRAIRLTLMKRSQMAQLAVFAAGVALDQRTKSWAVAELRSRGPIELFAGFLELHFVRNAGAFFGIGEGLPPQLRALLLSAASVLVIGLIIAMYLRASDQVVLRWALCLLASGAVGNLVDRVRHGSVVDFVHMHAGTVVDWATFNLADVWITAGLVVLVVEAVVQGSTRERQARLSQPVREGRG
jgi:signal peptidase II